MIKFIKIHKEFIYLIIFSFLPLLSFFYPGLPLTHDGQDHVARIANFYMSLREGNLIPRWAANLNWGYGHPILMFLYPLPSYTASVFHFIGFSLVDSTKLVFIFSYILSVLFMYLWLNLWLGKKIGIIGAILYAFAPYRFVDLYVRGAIGEHVAFIWPPLVLYFIYKIALYFKPETKIINLNLKLYYLIGLSLSMSLLILSHNAISIMFLPLIILYIIYLYFFCTEKNILFLIQIFSFLILGFMMSAFYLIPAFFEGKYTLRDIVTKGEYSSRFTSWLSFFYNPWNYGGTDTLSKSIGYVHWIGIISSIFYLIKKRKQIPNKLKIVYLGLVIIFILSLFLMTRSSFIIWQKITILQKFQFPWRFLSVTVFSSSVLGAIGIDYLFGLIHKITKFKYYYLLVAFSILIVCTTYFMWKPVGYLSNPELFFTGIYSGTTDTGESSPIWSVRFMEKTPKQSIEVIKGIVIINSQKRTTTLSEYSMDVKESARLVENTLFFPGWKVFIDGVPTIIQYQDSNYRGLITFSIPVGLHTVKIIFENTKLRSYSDLISLFSIISMVSILIIYNIWIKKRDII
jgi:hypothetical protein